MSILRKLGLVSLFSAVAVVSFINCGGGTNNDQGTSFSADGWIYRDPETGKIDPNIGITGTAVRVNVDRSPYGISLVEDDAIQCITFRNRMCKQNIRVMRIDCDYTVQGGMSLPSDSYNSSVNLEPEKSCSFESSSSSSSSSSSVAVGESQIVFWCFPIMGPDQLSYLMVNQNQFPALPLTVDATCRGVGITQAGDVLVSNDLFFPIELYESAECCTGVGAEGEGGYQVGTGSGGVPLGTVDSSSSSSATSADALMDN